MSYVLKAVTCYILYIKGKDKGPADLSPRKPLP